MHRLARAETSFGRWWLNLRVSARRTYWRWVQASGPAAKRMFDVAASLAFLALLSPLYLLIGVLVWLEDGHPALFIQTRVGRYGQPFRMYKFRSMCPDAEARLAEVIALNHHKQGVTFKTKNDPRLTRVGRWLRKFSLDELPQVWNVLRGEMSWVGPRPPLPREVARYSAMDRRRLAAKPGITCLWQIGGRSEIDFSGQVELDVRYIETGGFWEDLRIMMRTLPAVAGGKGAC